MNVWKAEPATGIESFPDGTRTRNEPASRDRNAYSIRLA